MATAVALAIVLTTSTAGCGEGNKLEQGKIVEKEYDDPDTGSELYCAVYGKYGCSLWLNRETYDGPHWNLRVVGADDKGKQHKEWHEVTETLWNEVVIGDVVNFPNMRRVAQ